MSSSEVPEGENQDTENRELMQFAEDSCEWLLSRSEEPESRLALAKRLLVFVIKWVGYAFLLPFWRQHITFSEIRRFRDTFFTDPKIERGHTGLHIYYFVNWLAWHVYRYIGKLDLDINDGRHAWEILQAIWARTFACPNGDFFNFFAELRMRSFEEFLKRDRSYFMNRNGDIFTKECEECLYYVLILSPRGNRFMRLLYGWACALIERKLLDIQKRPPIVRFLLENREHRMEQIKNIRREALARIERYAGNMLQDAIDHGESETAVGWNEVICRVRELQGFRPQADNLGRLATLIRELVERFNASARRIYVRYRAEDPAVPQLEEEESAPPPDEVKTHGRFRVEIDATHYRITDTIQNTRYKIKKDTHAGGAVRELILTYDTGTDQTHPSNDRWTGAFQSGRGDATEFKNDEIFMLPRWDCEKGKYLSNQYTRRWRLWLDEELAMSKAERVQRFMDTHPGGIPM